MNALIRFVLGVVLGVGVAGCTVPMVLWGSTQFGSGIVLGERSGPDETREVVFQFEKDEYRAIRVPSGWRQAPMRVGDAGEQGRGLELTALLAAEAVAPPGTEELKAGFTPVFSLDHRATFLPVLRTAPNTTNPVDHTLGSVSPEGDYFAVVRYLDGADHILLVVYGYDPGRCRWVRLSVPVDVNEARTHAAAALVLFPMTVAADGAALAADLALNLALALGGGGGGVALFTPLTYYAGSVMFRIAPTDQLRPVAAPTSLRP